MRKKNNGLFSKLFAVLIAALIIATAVPAMSFAVTSIPSAAGQTPSEPGSGTEASVTAEKTEATQAVTKAGTEVVAGADGTTNESKAESTKAASEGNGKSVAKVAGSSGTTISEPASTPKKVTLPMTVTFTNDGKVIAAGGSIDPTKDMEIFVNIPDVPVDGTVNAGDYIEVNLPAGLRFKTLTTIPVYMDVEGSTEKVKLGEVAISSSDPAKATLTFGSEVDNEEYSEIKNCWFKAGLSFDETQVDTSKETVVVDLLGNKYTIIIDKGAEDVHATLAKTGVLKDMSNGTIEWTIKASLDSEKGTYNGYVLTDTLPANLAYVDGSFKVNGQAAAGTLSVNGQTISYTLPDGTKGSQTITFDTTMVGYDKVNYGNISATNTANIKNAKTGDSSTASYTVTFQPQWFKKVGTYIEKDDSGNGHRLLWTLTVNASKASLKNATVTDVMADGLTLEESTLKVNGKAIAASAYKYDTDTNTLTIKLGDITDMQTVTFETSIHGGAKKTVENNATLTWDNGGTGRFGTGGKIDAGVDVDITAAYIKKSAGTYDYQNNILPWTVTVNRAGEKIEKARVVEIFIYSEDKLTTVNYSKMPSITGATEYAGLPVANNQDIIAGTFAGGTLTDKGVFTIDATKKIYAHIVECDLGDITTVKTLTFSTTLKNAKAVLTINGRSSQYSVVNNANLLYGTGGVLTGRKTVSLHRHMLEKTTYEDYNYDTHTLAWSLHINHNALALSGATVTDTLPKYFVPAGDGNTFFDVYEGAGTSWNGSPTIKLGTKLTDAQKAALVTATTTEANGQTTVTFKMNAFSKSYVIVIKAKVADKYYDEFFTNTNGPITVRNDATISGTDINGTPEDYEDNTINNMLLNKYGALTTDADGQYTGDVTWNLEVNMNKANLAKDMTKAYVIDDLNSYLKLNKRTGGGYDVKMWNMTRDAKGNWIEGAQIDDATVQATITYDESTNQFRVALPDPAGSYKIKFVTAVTDDTVTSITNTARFEGTKTEITSDKKTIVMEYGDGGAYAKIAGQITVTKQDEKTAAKLSGAVFALYKANDDSTQTKIGEKTTDSTGTVTFKRLKSGTYTVEELTAPLGYVLPETTKQTLVLDTSKAAAKKLTFTFKDAQLTRGVQIMKTDDTGAALEGAVFTLYKNSVSADNMIGDATTSVNGTATWSGLVPGTYVIIETKAPLGYTIPASQNKVTATVGKDGSVKYSTKDGGVPTLVNDANIGVISIMKTDEDGAPLEGAVFTMYDTSAKEIATAKSDTTGAAKFENVRPGNYVIKETEAPTGYIKSSELFRVTAADFTESGKVITFTLANEKKPVETPTPAPTDTPTPTPEITSFPTPPIPLTSATPTPDTTEIPTGTVSLASATPDVTNIPSDTVPLASATPDNGTVKTGDSTNIMLWIIILAVAAIGATVLIVVAVRKKTK